jgi:hypothetical protein
MTDSLLTRNHLFQLLPLFMRYCFCYRLISANCVMHAWPFCVTEGEPQLPFHMAKPHRDFERVSRIQSVAVSG